MSDIAILYYHSEGHESEELGCKIERLVEEKGFSFKSYPLGISCSFEEVNSNLNEILKADFKILIAHFDIFSDKSILTSNIRVSLKKFIFEIANLPLRIILATSTDRKKEATDFIEEENDTRIVIGPENLTDALDRFAAELQLPRYSFKYDLEKTEIQRLRFIEMQIGADKERHKRHMEILLSQLYRGERCEDVYLSYVVPGRSGSYLLRCKGTADVGGSKAEFCHIIKVTQDSRLAEDEMNAYRTHVKAFPSLTRPGEVVGLVQSGPWKAFRVADITHGPYKVVPLAEYYRKSVKTTEQLQTLIERIFGQEWGLSKVYKQNKKILEQWCLTGSVPDEASPESGNQPCYQFYGAYRYQLMDEVQELLNYYLGYLKPNNYPTDIQEILLDSRNKSQGSAVISLKERIKDYIYDGILTYYRDGFMENTIPFIAPKTISVLAHGDLNMGNILVKDGTSPEVFLIDFARTSKGQHIFTDFARLESHVKFLEMGRETGEDIDPDLIPRWLKMEQYLAGKQLDDIEKEMNSNVIDPMKRCALFVIMLRKQARTIYRELLTADSSSEIERIERQGAVEYWIALLCYTLNILRYPQVPKTKKLYALLSSQILFEQIAAENPTFGRC